MPRKMWNVDFQCPTCTRSLRSKGLYNRVRLVLDVVEYYYLGSEYMDCNTCKGTYIAWDSRMLSQLTDEIRGLFPVILTYKYATDQSVVGLLRSRTLGNSPSALQNNIQEMHTKLWLKRQMLYLSDCDRHKRGRELQKLGSVTYNEGPKFQQIPGAKWFLACYVRDVWSRLDTLKAQITSVYGGILKVDSTKKITKKLQGIGAGSASWATSVGNERGEILQSVITASESTTSLKEMADGLMARYENAQENHPVALYTDRDCCSSTENQSKYQVLFNKWENLIVRLDIFHYMRRFAIGCTSESHPLYGTFMTQLSRSIFEWDSNDVAILRNAKWAEIAKDLRISKIKQ